MRVTTFTRLWPNRTMPDHGIFIAERMRRVVSADLSLSVIAPVPWWPVSMGPERWTRFQGVPEREEWNGIPVLHPRYPVIPAVGLRLQGHALARVAAREIAAVRPDLIDAHFLYPDGLAAVAAGKALGIPVVVSARGSDANTLPDRMPGPVAATLAGAIMLIAVSRPIAKRLVSLGADPSKVAVIPNGVDAEVFRFDPRSRAEVRDRLGVPEGSPLILSVGRLERVKGHDLLLEALARLRHGPRLVIVGAGRIQAQLAHQADSLGLSDRVTFLGALPHEALPRWYSAADLFCLPSRAEGHPNVLLEALACGTPVVATDVGAVSESLPPAGGMVVPPADSRWLATGLAAMLDQISRGRFPRPQVRATVAGLSWDATAVAVRGVFEEAILRHQPSVPSYRAIPLEEVHP